MNTVGMEQRGVDEDRETGSGNKETPALLTDQTHPLETAELGRDGFSCGADQVGQVLVGEWKLDHGAGGTVCPVSVR